MSTKSMLLLSFGAGIFMGSSLTFAWIYKQQKHQMQKFFSQISHIQGQLDSLKCMFKKIEVHIQEKRSESVEDDDIFEEAYDGPLPWLSSICSSALSSSENEKVDKYSALNKEDITIFFNQIDTLFNGNESDQQKAHELLEQRSLHMYKNVEFVWRLSKSTFLLSQVYAQIDKNKQKDLVYGALKHAKHALHLDNSSANAHKWYAITLGSTNDFESVNSKIENGYSFKEHIEQAILLNPKDPSAHYLLGRWCLGVYMLSWIERKIATTLFSSPPKATIDESLNHFLKANELNPVEWKENMLFISKCYIEKKDFHKALKWLNRAKNLPIITNEDSKNQLEIDMLIVKCS